MDAVWFSCCVSEQVNAEIHGVVKNISVDRQWQDWRISEPAPITLHIDTSLLNCEALTLFFLQVELVWKQCSVLLLWGHYVNFIAERFQNDKLLNVYVNVKRIKWKCVI